MTIERGRRRLCSADTDVRSALDAATTLEELRAVPVSRSEACAIAADAPWSDDCD